MGRATTTRPASGLPLSQRLPESIDEQGFAPVRTEPKSKPAPHVAVGILATYNANRLSDLERRGQGNTQEAKGLKREVEKSRSLGPRMKREGIIPQDADVDEFFADL